MSPVIDSFWGRPQRSTDRNCRESKKTKEQKLCEQWMDVCHKAAVAVQRVLNQSFQHDYDLRMLTILVSLTLIFVKFSFNGLICFPSIWSWCSHLQWFSSKPCRFFCMCVQKTTWICRGTIRMIICHPCQFVASECYTSPLHLNASCVIFAGGTGKKKKLNLKVGGWCRELEWQYVEN